MLSKVFFLAVCSVVMGLPYKIDQQELDQMAMVLNEDEFEDYLEGWLQIEEAKWTSQSYLTRSSRSGCTIRINGDLGQPQPVYIHNDKYLSPTGNTGLILLITGEEVIVSCTGSGRLIQHPNITSSVSTATATCVSNALVTGSGWLNGSGEFGELTCSANSNHAAEATSDTCYNDNTVIRVGHIVNEVFYPLYRSCFDQNRLEVLYVTYEINVTNAVHQNDVARPSFLAGSFFPGVAVNTMYTKAQQTVTITNLVGEELASKYVTSSQYLARGHLAAMVDFVFATAQRATFYYINAAPQWQLINSGNWKTIEQDVRSRVAEAGYNTTVYCGTFGVTQLRDEDDQLIDIYLYTDKNNNQQIPVPLYYFKVVHEQSLQIATAFITINNPYYTEDEVKALTFCTDRCRDNSSFDWLSWTPDNIAHGYSFCCEIDDFRNTVPYLPEFTVTDLLF